LLFDGTLGDWKTKPVSFQLKEGASPYRSQVFPVPKIHIDTLIKRWKDVPFVYTTKKKRTVCFLIDFWEVNKRLIRKLFPIPKMSMVLQEVKGFTIALALDLNMGCYTIILDPDAYII
jgi:hypothetical protein